MLLPRSFMFLRHGETDWNRQGLFEALCSRLCDRRFEGKHAAPYRFGPVADGWEVSEIS